MSVFNFRSNHKIKKKTNLSYQEREYKIEWNAKKNLIASTLQTTGCGSKNRNKRNTNISADIRKFTTPYYYFLNISPFNIARWLLSFL